MLKTIIILKKTKNLSFKHKLNYTFLRFMLKTGGKNSNNDLNWVWKIHKIYYLKICLNICIPFCFSSKLSLNIYTEKQDKMLINISFLVFLHIAVFTYVAISKNVPGQCLYMETIQCCLSYRTWIIPQIRAMQQHVLLVCVCVLWKTLQLHNSCYVIHSVTLPNSECTATEILQTCAALSVLCVTVSVKHRFSPVYMTWNNSLAGSRHGARDWWIACKDLHNTCSLRSGSPLHQQTTSGPSVYRITVSTVLLLSFH